MFFSSTLFRFRLIMRLHKRLIFKPLVPFFNEKTCHDITPTVRLIKQTLKITMCRPMNLVKDTGHYW